MLVGIIPPEVCAAFASAMERVLEVYARLHDPARPLVCLDETSKQLIRETRIPLPHGPGREARVDYEYERAGVVNLFMLFVRWKVGAKSPFAIGAPPSIMPMSCASWPMCIFLRSTRSYSCKTISTPTMKCHCTRHSPPMRPAASRIASSGTTPPNMGPGSIWPNVNSAFSADNASPGASLIKQL